VVSCFRFDVHGFTADSQQDEPGVKEAAQRRELSLGRGAPSILK